MIPIIGVQEMTRIMLPTTMAGATTTAIPIITIPLKPGEAPTIISNLMRTQDLVGEMRMTPTQEARVLVISRTITTMVDLQMEEIRGGEILGQAIMQEVQAGAISRTTMLGDLLTGETTTRTTMGEVRVGEMTTAATKTLSLHQIISSPAAAITTMMVGGSPPLQPLGAICRLLRALKTTTTIIIREEQVTGTSLPVVEITLEVVGIHLEVETAARRLMAGNRQVSIRSLGRTGSSRLGRP